MIKVLLLVRLARMLIREIQHGNLYAITGVAIFAGVFAAYGVVSLIRRASPNPTEDFGEATALAPPEDRFTVPER